MNRNVGDRRGRIADGSGCAGRGVGDSSEEERRERQVVRAPDLIAFGHSGCRGGICYRTRNRLRKAQTPSSRCRPASCNRWTVPARPRCSLVERTWPLRDCRRFLILRERQPDSKVSQAMASVATKSGSVTKVAACDQLAPEDARVPCALPRGAYRAALDGVRTEEVIDDAPCTGLSNNTASGVVNTKATPEPDAAHT